MSDPIEQFVRTQVIEEFLDGDEDELTAYTRLIEDEVLDSMGIFALVGQIEERFGFEIDPAEITAENFQTVAAIGHATCWNATSPKRWWQSASTGFADQAGEYQGTLFRHSTTTSTSSRRVIRRGSTTERG